MKPATILPNHIYCSENGLLIYTIKEENDKSSFLSVVLGPILSEVTDYAGVAPICVSKLLPRIKFAQAYPRDKRWYEVQLPRRVMCRLFVAMDAIAACFEKMSSEMKMKTVTVQKFMEFGPDGKIYQTVTPTDITERQFDEIRSKATASRGIERYDTSRYLEYPISYVFESSEQSNQFVIDLDNLGDLNVRGIYDK